MNGRGTGREGREDATYAREDAEASRGLRGASERTDALGLTYSYFKPAIRVFADATTLLVSMSTTVVG